MLSKIRPDEFRDGVEESRLMFGMEEIGKKDGVGLDCEKRSDCRPKLRQKRK